MSISNVSGPNVSEEEFGGKAAMIYNCTKAAVQEFNACCDLFAGANIHGFLHVANVMLNRGAV